MSNIKTIEADSHDIAGETVDVTYGFSKVNPGKFAVHLHTEYQGIPFTYQAECEGFRIAMAQDPDAAIQSFVKSAMKAFSAEIVNHKLRESM